MQKVKTFYKKNKSLGFGQMWVKQIFISALMYFGNPSSVNSLECVSMKIQECKARPEIVDINNINPIFYPLVLRQKINVVVIVIILTIHMQEFVFMIL